MFIGVGQSGASRSRGQTQMTKFSPHWRPSLRKFRATTWHVQLAKEHGDELTQLLRTSGMPLSAVLAHGQIQIPGEGSNCKICEKILQTRVKAEPP